MDAGKKYYLVKACALPDILKRVLRAKNGLDGGRYKSINEAVSAEGISRSAYYKYKDAAQPFYDLTGERILAFYALLQDEPGVLSGILSFFAKTGANILTINQSMPVNGQATVTITAQTGKMTLPLGEMINTAVSLPGVTRFELLAGE